MILAKAVKHLPNGINLQLKQEGIDGEWVRHFDSQRKSLAVVKEISTINWNVDLAHSKKRKLIKRMRSIGMRL